MTTLAAFTRASRAGLAPLAQRAQRLFARVPFGVALFACLLLALGFLFPLYWLVTGSFKLQSATQAMPPEWFPSSPTLDNYRRLLANFPTWRWTFNSLFVASATTGLTMVFSSMAGYGFARLYIPGKRVLFGALLFAMMMPRQVILVPLFILMVRLDWQNTYQGLILPLVAWPYTVFLFRQYIRALPSELFDAARIDGATELDLYWRIVLPLSRPALAAVGIFVFINTWNDYMWQLVLITQREMATLPVAISTVITARSTVDFGLGMAAASFASLPMMLIFLIFQRYFIKGITMGALKG